MKTLVYILPDNDAGVASVVRNLLRFKSGRFVTKVILLYDVNYPKSGRNSSILSADKIIKLEFNKKWSSKYDILKRIRKELDDDSILVSNDGSVEIDVVGFFGLNIPVVYIMHGNNGHYYNVIEYKRQFISKIITVSDYIKLKLESKFDDVLVASIKFPVPDVTTTIKLPSKKIRLAFVGSLIEAKGVYDLIPILEKLELASINYSLNIIGDGKEGNKLKEKLAPYQSVRFWGKLPNHEVLAMHRGHDIILLPSRNEGLPVVIVEAMKCGVVPVVSDLNSGIPELVDHKKNGFRVALNEISRCADYIMELDFDREKLKMMSALCIEKANSMFNAKLQTEAYEDAIVVADKNKNVMSFKKKLPYYIPSNLLRLLNK